MPWGAQSGEVIRYEQLDQLIDRALAISGDELVELTEEICCEAEAGQMGQILNARCIPYIDRAGRNVGTITVLHDITTLKHMDQIKSEFVSMVSHEIRSPLNSVLAQLQDNPGRPGRRGQPKATGDPGAGFQKGQEPGKSFFRAPGSGPHRIRPDQPGEGAAQPVRHPG